VQAQQQPPHPERITSSSGLQLDHAALRQPERGRLRRVLAGQLSSRATTWCMTLLGIAKGVAFDHRLVWVDVTL
jgi:hypothetical protein